MTAEPDAPDAHQVEPGQDTGWMRLHPLSPVVQVGPAVLAIAIAIASRGVQRQQDSGIGRWLPDLLVFALGIAAGTISWAVTRWRVQRGELAIDTGLIRRSSVRLPLSRMQAIDVVRPPLARIFGLAEIRVVVAGSGGGRGRLAYLRIEEAERVRARLLALAHGVHEETPEPPERFVVGVANGRLVASALLGVPTLLLLLLGAADIAVAATVGTAAALTLLSSLVSVVIICLSLLARRIGTEFGQTVAEAPDGLRLRSGLLQTRAETVPFARLQALRWTEPLLWRPLGWCRLELDVARQRNRRGDGANRDNGATSRALLPVGSRPEGATLLDGFMPGVVASRVWTADRPPRRALLKAPLSWRHLGFWHDDRVVVVGAGRLRRSATIVPLHKVQTFRLVQGPLARALDVSTLHLDLVGRRWPTAARCRPAAEAEDLMATLVDLARQARAAERHGRT